MNPRASSHRSLLPSSSTRLFIDPVGPMPPSIPPSMRMMRFPAPRQETLLFEELFQGCRQMPVHDVDEEEEDNVTLELMPGARVPKRPKIDLTLTLKPPTNESP
nr:transcription activator GLK2-like isoform X3 [Ipomoea trifida]